MTAQVFVQVQFGDMKSHTFVSLKTLEEVREYFQKHIPDLPVPLPETFSNLVIRHANEDKTSEAWLWSPLEEGNPQSNISVDHLDLGTGYGWLVAVDGKEVFFNWVPNYDDED